MTLLSSLNYWSAYPNTTPTLPSLSQGRIRLPLKLWIIWILMMIFIRRLREAIKSHNRLNLGNHPNLPRPPTKVGEKSL